MFKASMVILMATLTFIVPGHSMAQTARSLKVAHVFAIDHPVHQGLLKANELLKQKSAGKLELTIFPAGTFANYQGALQAVRLGTLDMAPLDTAIEQYPESGALLAPYAFRDYDHWKKFKASAPYQARRCRRRTPFPNGAAFDRETCALCLQCRRSERGQWQCAVRPRF
jgi:TRAP-type C4-dicarboxylate transport system substrate-binding protein